VVSKYVDKELVQNFRDETSSEKSTLNTDINTGG
jgi:hypothetical protein